MGIKSISLDDPRTLCLDNGVFDQKKNGIFSSVSQLKFDTSAFELEEKVCGTESLNLLASNWHLVSATTENNKQFNLDSVIPAMTVVQKSIITTDEDLAGMVTCNLADTSSDGSSTTTNSYPYISDDYERILFYLTECEKNLGVGDAKEQEKNLSHLNSLLTNLITYKVIDDTLCFAYDEKLIDYILSNTDSSSLVHMLVQDLKDNMGENGKISEVKGWGNRSYSVELVRCGAGYQLKVTCDSKIIGAEVKDKTVAYAATKESAEEYFYCDKDKKIYNWENIKEWLKQDSQDPNSIEYEVFASMMVDMSDAELQRVLNYGMVSSLEDVPGPGKYFAQGSETYHVSENLKLIADRYALAINVAKYSGDYDKGSLNECRIIDDQETRSIAFLEAVKAMMGNGGVNMVADISSEGDEGSKVYTISITGCANMPVVVPVPQYSYTGSAGIMGEQLAAEQKSRRIVVYPRGDAEQIANDAMNHAGKVLNSNIHFIYSGKMTDSDYELIASQALAVFGDVAGDVAESASAVIGKAMIGVNVAILAKDLAEDYRDSAEADNAIDVLSSGRGAMSMDVTGTVIVIDGGKSGTVEIRGLEYNENELKVRVEAYNLLTEQDITVDELKDHYVNGDQEFDSYEKWYYESTDRNQRTNYKELVEYALAQEGVGSVESATKEQLELAISNVNSAIETVNPVDKDGSTDLRDKESLEKVIHEYYK